jgi:hypothetical protein
MEMKRLSLFEIVGLAVVTSLVAFYARAAEPELQRNPFDRPEEILLISSSAPANRNLTVESRPLLRAVLAAGPNSVVNLGGVILQVGESANGYRLLSVEEDGATFSRDGEKVVLSLFEPAEDL